jgi:membrane associated rhomboid family serine protease
MIFPVDDNKNAKSVAYATHLLIAINIGVFAFVSWPAMHTPIDLSLLQHESESVLLAIAENSSGVPSQYSAICAKYGYQANVPNPVDMVTCQFLHTNAFHLFINVVFLWIVGNNVEGYFGSGLFVCIYLLSGIAALVFFSQFITNTMLPALGASGSIAGILGCYYILFPDNKIKIYCFLFPLIFNFFIVPARMFIGFFILADNLYPFLRNTTLDQIAYSSHIGGFITGLFLALCFRFFVKNTPNNIPAQDLSIAENYYD